MAVSISAHELIGFADICTDHVVFVRTSVRRTFRVALSRLEVHVVAILAFNTKCAVVVVMHLTVLSHTRHAVVVRDQRVHTLDTGHCTHHLVVDTSAAVVNTQRSRVTVVADAEFVEIRILIELVARRLCVWCHTDHGAVVQLPSIDTVKAVVLSVIAPGPATRNNLWQTHSIGHQVCAVLTVLADVAIAFEAVVETLVLASLTLVMDRVPEVACLTLQALRDKGVAEV